MIPDPAHPPMTPVGPPPPSPDWMNDAYCSKTTEPDKFFSDDPAIIKYIRETYCLRCPVRHECLTWALTEREEYGIWGGCTPKQRRRILRRPRKKPTPGVEFLTGGQPPPDPP
jgi:WhiB family redox-sensing transcriptional regulator